MKKRSSRTGIVLFVIGVAATCSATAEIYKWVDEDGNVHFSDSAPEEATPAERIEPDIAPPAAVPDIGEQRRLDLVREMQARTEREARAAERDAAQAEVWRPRENPVRCDQARVDFVVLHEPLAVYRTETGDIRAQWTNDAYRGERTYIADEDREQAKQQAVDEIYEHCADPENQAALDHAYTRWLDAEWCQVNTIALEQALKPRSRSSDSEIERLQQEVDYFCGPAGR